MILFWAVILGAVGFICGFIGPMVLAPQANQGPLLGLLITGPGGALLGVVLGAAARAAGLSARNSGRAVAALACIIAVTTLYFCIPSPQHKSDVVEGDILACVSAESLKQQAVERLSAREASQPQPKSTNWAQKFDDTIADRSGVVIDLQVHRVQQVFEKRARWNYGDRVETPWVLVDKRESFYLEGQTAGCSEHPAGTQVTFSVTGGTEYWPPSGSAEMLGVRFAKAM